MSFSITGKTAIVTGAAKGLGLAVARHFVERGAHVMAADMDEGRLQDELGRAASQEGPIRLFGGDLRQKLCLSNLLSATHDAFERVDILVNAARVAEPGDPLDPETDGVDHHLRANVLPMLRLSQMVAARMIRQMEGVKVTEGGAGAIVNLSSLAPLRSRPELMGFALASGAVEQITRSMAVALAPQRIRVNALAIGSVMTSSLQLTLRDQPERREEIVAATPLGWIASAREAVETVQYLASDASSFMTGQVVTLDGGRSLYELPVGICV